MSSSGEVWNTASSLAGRNIAMVDPSKRRLKRVVCYLPIAAAGLEFVWIFVLFLALIFSVGDTSYVNTPEKSRFFEWLSIWPAAAGVGFGLVHQVSDWGSGAAAYFGWMREAKRENTRCGL